MKVIYLAEWKASKMTGGLRPAPPSWRERIEQLMEDAMKQYGERKKGE